MAKLPDDYEMSEKDIDWVIEYLKVKDPEHATALDAIDFLEFNRTFIHQMAHREDINLEDLYNKYKNRKV